jgi:hypothetical protein
MSREVEQRSCIAGARALGATRCQVHHTFDEATLNLTLLCMRTTLLLVTTTLYKSALQEQSNFKRWICSAGCGGFAQYHSVSSFCTTWESYPTLQCNIPNNACICCTVTSALQGIAPAGRNVAVQLSVTGTLEVHGLLGISCSRAS